MEAAVRRAQARGPWVHHLEATVEAHVLCAARVRERTGIRYARAVIERCWDKIAMKAFRAGFPVRAPVRVLTRGGTKGRCDLGLPVILAPDGAGLRGPTRSPMRTASSRPSQRAGSGMASLTMEEFLTATRASTTLIVGGQTVFDTVCHDTERASCDARHPSWP